MLIRLACLLILLGGCAKEGGYYKKEIFIYRENGVTVSLKPKRGQVMLWLKLKL